MLALKSIYLLKRLICKINLEDKHEQKASYVTLVIHIIMFLFKVMPGHEKHKYKHK